MNESNNVGEIPQKEAESVDVDVVSSESSRARAGEAHEGEARAVENDIHLRDDMSVREIILAHPRVRILMVATAVRCMGASKLYYSKGSKEFKPEADFATQMKAITWLAAYSDGLPIQTNLNLNAQANGRKEFAPVDMLAESPAAMEAMERTLEAAREKARRTKAGPQVQ